MTKRHEVQATTVLAVASDYAGRPLKAEQAAMFATLLEANQQQLGLLRRLPLKDCEPATVFRPAVPPRHD